MQGVARPGAGAAPDAGEHLDRNSVRSCPAGTVAAAMGAPDHDLLHAHRGGAAERPRDGVEEDIVLGDRARACDDESWNLIVAARAVSCAAPRIELDIDIWNVTQRRSDARFDVSPGRIADAAERRNRDRRNTLVDEELSERVQARVAFLDLPAVTPVALGGQIDNTQPLSRNAVTSPMRTSPRVQRDW